MSSAYRSTSELVTTLLASYPDHEYAGGPFVLFYSGRDLDSYPAWRWTTELIRKRSDWWPALGVALQHAATEGGELARSALADLHEHFPKEAQVLLRWTEPIARKYANVLSKYHGANRKLATIIGEQIVRWDASNDAPIEIDIYDGDGDTPVKTRIRTHQELESALTRCAKKGMPCAPDKGPWSWLVDESLSRPWLPALLPPACANLAEGELIEVRAMLDFLCDEFDLWRYVDLMEGWSANPPSWWTAPARMRKPRGWTSRARWRPGHKTLGDVARAHLEVAREQLATKPILDLACA